MSVASDPLAGDAGSMTARRRPADSCSSGRNEAARERSSRCRSCGEPQRYTRAISQSARASFKRPSSSVLEASFSHSYGCRSTTRSSSSRRRHALTPAATSSCSANTDMSSAGACFSASSSGTRAKSARASGRKPSAVATTAEHKVPTSAVAASSRSRCARLRASWRRCCASCALIRASAPAGS